MNIGTRQRADNGNLGAIDQLLEASHRVASVVAMPADGMFVQRHRFWAG
jgi:hypothetical protein